MCRIQSIFGAHIVTSNFSAIIMHSTCGIIQNEHIRTSNLFILYFTAYLIAALFL